MSDGRAKSLDSRLPHIDGLRGLAILLVLLTHAWAFSGAPALSITVGRHSIVLASIPAIGYVGVNLFLVLSGFCLAWPFMRDRSYRDRMTIGAFWLRRIRRIVPAYYLSIVLVIAILLACDRLMLRVGGGAGRHYPWVPSFADLWPHLLFVHNFSVDHVSTINGSYWSLALEFQLYLMFPLLLAAMFRWGPWRVVGVVLAIQLAYRLYLEATLPAGVLTEFEFVLPKAMIGRMLDFACGMAAAHFVAEGLRRHSRIPGVAWITIFSASCLVAGFVLTYGHWAPFSLIDVFWSFGFAALVCSASGAGGACNKLFCYRPLVLLGLCSYSVYLMHQPLVELSANIVRGFFRPGTAFFVELACLPFIVGLSVAFFYSCEKPFLDWFSHTRSTGVKRSTSEPTVEPSRNELVRVEA